MHTFDLDDTICAVATPPGSGGIAVIRLSGSSAVEVADSLWQGKTPLTAVRPATAPYGRLMDGDDTLDDAVATVWRAPHSYTGQDTVEFSVHGSPYIQQRLLQLLCEKGARLALPGEYTRRAFANGRLDLARAEAVADVIAASSRTQHRLAQAQLSGRFSARIDAIRESIIRLASLLTLELDFSEEDVTFAPRAQLAAIAADALARMRRLADTFDTGRALADGLPVAIVGPPNAGKSTLLNGLLGYDRAIVSDISGTTRDTLDATLTIDGTLFRLIDTAGLRPTDDPLERAGITRSLQAVRQAAIVLRVVDAAQPATDHFDAPPHARVITLCNKTDLAPAPSPLPADTLAISALRPTDIRRVRQALAEAAPAVGAPDAVVTNLRHAEALAAAADALQRVIDGLASDLTTDLVAEDLRQAVHHLGLITGAVTTDDILHTVFAHFCVGK